MKNQLVTAGCSLTKDFQQLTWANYLADMLGYELNNVAARGAGMSFISKRVIMATQTCDPTTTSVVVLLPSSDRFDCYIDESHVLLDEFVKVSSWQDGRQPQLVNLDGTISSQHGYSLTGGEARGLKSYWYKYYHNNTAAHINYWFDVLHLQNYLKLRGFEYWFISAYDVDNTVEQSSNNNSAKIEYNSMQQLIDWEKFIFHRNRCGFLTYAREHQFEFVRHYPVTEAHCAFVENIMLPVIRNGSRS